MKQLVRWNVIRRVLLGVMLTFIAIQFVPVERSNPPVQSEVPASAQVRDVLRRSCYDCHSNETVWPWYSHVAPVSWLVAKDVREGREELNFSAWNRISPQKQVKKLKKSWKEVEEGEMPMPIYLVTHHEARLSADDRATLRDWALGASGPQATNP